jgi:hypothetical protein
MKAVSGNPDPKHVSTSFVERQKLDGSHYDAPLHSPLEWFLAQTRESCGCDGAQLFRLQLHQNSSYTSRVFGYGRWRFGSAVERRRFGSPLGSLRTAEGGKSGVNKDELRSWYLSLTDSEKQVFLSLVSNHLTIHGRDFYRYLPGTEPKTKAFQAFEGLNELQHQISGHIAAIGLKHDRYPDEVLWKILDEKAAAYGLTAHLRQSLDSARSRNCWSNSK